MPRINKFRNNEVFNLSIHWREERCKDSSGPYRLNDSFKMHPVFNEYTLKPYRGIPKILALKQSDEEVMN